MGAFEKMMARAGYVKSARADMEWRQLLDFLGVERRLTGGAMSEATYYACTKILRETLGKLPLRLMRRTDGGGVETCHSDPLYRLLAVRPNPYMTATTFWACVEQARNHLGNAYVYVERDGRGRPRNLWFMPNSEVDVWYDDACRILDRPDIFYRWSSGGSVLVLKSYEVLHFKSSDTYDGVMGIPLIDRLRGLVDGSVGAQGFQNELITSGLTAKAVVQYTADLSDDKAKTFVRGLESYAKGEVDGARSIIPIPVGATITPLNTKLTDAQFEELKKYSAVQIASAFGIKPQQIGDMTKQSYASSQAQQEAFYTDTMLYILRDYENEVGFKALGEDMAERGYYVEFDTSVMLRSDYKTMVEANRAAIESGQSTPNESRLKLNLPALPGGDALMCNGAMIPLTMLGQQYKRDSGEGGD